MPPRPKIALDARLYRGTMTGDSTYWTGLIDALMGSSNEFELLLMSDQPCPPDAPENVRAAWRHLTARNGRVWSLLIFPLAALQLEASAVHTQYSLPPTKLPTITTIHDVSFMIGPEWFPLKDRLLLRRSIPSAVQRASAIVTVSRTSQADIERFFPVAKGKTFPIHNGPNSAIQRVDSAAQKLRDSIGFGGPFVLSVSTQWPRKNMQLAVDAMNLVPPDIPHKLVLTGKSGWGGFNPTDRVFTTGYVSNEILSALYSAADLYLCPSFHEGFGIPLVEAFGCGCPVICSPGGALPEVGKGAAAIMPDFSPVTWAAAIQELLSDSSKLAEMRTNGLERAKQFSWAQSAEAHLDVYRRVLT